VKEIINEIKLLLNSKDSIDNKLINGLNYNTDGLIMTPLDGSQELKVKPKNLLTIDLLTINGRWLDRENNNWSSIVDMNCKTVKNDKIYRLYPKNQRFVIGEIRFDKKKPNTNQVVNQITSQLPYNWLNESINSLPIYYEKQVTITNSTIINLLNNQRMKLKDIIMSINPMK
jgi:hypothetical protein